MRAIIARLDSLPTWLKVVLWQVAGAAIDAVYNQITAGNMHVDPQWIPVWNVILVAARDFIRSKQSEGTPNANVP